MGATESKVLDNKSNIEFNFYIEPLISNDNDEIDIDDLSTENCEKIKNYYDSKCFSITFEKFLKHDFLKFKMSSVVFEDNMLFFNGNIVLKNNNDNNDNNLSLNEIEDFINKNIELNKENLLLKNNNDNIYYNISFEKDNISEIDFEFKIIEDKKNNDNDNNKINLNRKINVIPLGAYSDINSIKNKDFKNIKKKFNLPERYIFCGTNTCAHKNLNPLFAAMNILKKKHQHLNLVLTGPGTEIINGISDEYGVQLNDIKRDVYGLGYVHNDELELIIENAQLIINPEMYTSDNGPATDGWAKGKPVIIADIPSNREHINNQFVYAELFNFRDPEDIANKIEKIVNNKDNKYINYASKSKISISNVKWEAVAENYLKVFNQK